VTARTGPRRPVLAAATILLASALAVALCEAGVRFLEHRREAAAGATRAAEEDYHGHSFRQDELGPGGMLAEGFRGRVLDEYGRLVPWINNGSGFRRRQETPLEPPPGTQRVLLLGDSYVAGYRVGQDDTFGQRLETALREEDGLERTEVLISAIEEPVTGLYYLQTRGLAYRPRLVVVGITLANDVAQAWFALDREGSYRLAPEPAVLEPNPQASAGHRTAVAREMVVPTRCTTGTGHAPVAWEPAPPGPSHLLSAVENWWSERRDRSAPQTVSSTWGEYRRPRLFDSNGVGIFLQPPPPEVRRAYRRLFVTLDGYRRLCARAGVELLVVLFPQRYQVQPLDWQATIDAYGLRPGCFDLEAPARRILAHCTAAGIHCVDLAPAFRAERAASGRSLYMPRADMHWNLAGHRLAAATLLAPVEHALRAPRGPRSTP
jgi:hypothetical protein